MSEISPEWILSELKKIKDPKIFERSKQLFGMK